MRALSLGGGVQSSTLLLMSLSGELESLDAVAFADTGAEPESVYQHISWLEAQTRAAGVPFYRVSGGDLGQDALAGNPTAWIPLHVNTETGSAMLRRQCTTHYKLRPIQRQLRALGATAKRPAECWLGISVDEAARMKPSRVQYAHNRWPLVELRMSRHDCVRWLETRGFRIPPKSACVFCPFHDQRYWHWLKHEQPDDWDRAVTFDRLVRNRRMADPVFVHHSRLALDQVDLSTPEEHGQLRLFAVECEGMCGL